MNRFSSLRLPVILLCLILGCLVFSLCVSLSNAGDYTNPIRISIKVSKDVFTLGEPVEGKVIIENIYPATLPATFNIKVFHDGELVRRFFTSVKHLFMGETDFAFKNFGIPTFTGDKEELGEWRITIIQQNVSESYEAEAIFTIVER